MSPVSGNTTDMTHSQIVDSGGPAVAVAATTTGLPDSDHTATGIPISLLWMPYVGFSLFLILLMFVSFLHYHRKHGHKYHHHQQFWGNEMSVASVLGNISNQITNIGKRAGHTDPQEGTHGRFKIGRDSRRDSKDPTPRSKAIGYRGVEEYVPPAPVNPPPQNLPPNGGLHINRSSKADILGSGRTHNRASKPQYESGSVHHRILPSQPTSSQQPSTHPHRPGHRARPRNAHCDEPSTSSSTVSSKTSNQSTKPGGGGNSGGRNRPAHNRRHKRPLVFEANENGSMVDIRVSLKEDCQTIELKPTPKERGPSMQNNIDYPACSNESTIAQKHNNPSYRYSIVEEEDIQPSYRNNGHGEETRRKLPQNYSWAPASDSNIYPNNPSYRGKYRDVNPDEYSIYEDRNSRSTSLPIWSTMPLCPKPPPPRRDFYSYPFTPSGHMEMLSDTENDEVFLLQHTKL